MQHVLKWINFCKIKTNMMKEFNSVNDILDFAMGQEQGAVDFYTQIAGYARNAEMKKDFSGLRLRKK